MGQISILIGGRTYAISCRDGEEQRLQGLAQLVNKKTADLQTNLGQVSEPRLLLMAALLLADDLQESRDRLEDADPVALPLLLDNLTERLERVARALEPMDASA